MVLPEGFNEWEHFQHTLKRHHNKAVREFYRDQPDNSIGGNRASAKHACIMKDNDTTILTVLRMWLFWVICRKMRDNFEPYYGIPIATFDSEVKYKPQITCFFQEEPQDVDIQAGYRPVEGQLSVRLINVKRWEGFRANAYLCPANVWTIGYGHTKTTKAGTCISHAEAEELLKQDLIGFENAVRKLVKVDLTQNQFDSLVSFTFNVGIHAFGKSTLLRRLNAKQYLNAANEFERWVYANKNKLPGLVKRRTEEKNMFLS